MNILDHRRNKTRSQQNTQRRRLKQPRGQILVIIAFAMIGLAVATGLALDGGMLFLRKSQLNRAVDAAALAGVTKLDPADIAIPNTHGQQLMAANGMRTTSAANCDSVNWSINDYCGKQGVGNIPGSDRYTVEAKYIYRTFFMRLLRIDMLTIRSTATAEILPTVDLYASDTNEIGLVKVSNQAIFGPAQQTSFGDPYTPISSDWYEELDGAYTYRVRIPVDYETRSGTTKVRIEIFDPDTGNHPIHPSTPIPAPQPTDHRRAYGVEGTIAASDYACPGTARKNACISRPTPWSGSLSSNPNPAWFIQVDENRSPGSDGPEYLTNLANNTRTLYRLYYLEETADGALVEVDLAYYIGKAHGTNPVLPSSGYTGTQANQEAINTDLRWVSPGVPAAERMPSFTATTPTPGQRQCIFEEIDALYGAAAVGNPTTKLCSDAEPVTYTENCELYRANNPGHTDAERCASGTAATDFIIDLATEVPGIYADAGSGMRDIYLQVRGLSGSSENGFEFWAGPPRTADPLDFDYTVPSNINARQVYMLATQIESNSTDLIHRTAGVHVTGLGHLPMNSNITGVPVEIALAYIGPEFSGQELTIEMFDPDSGAEDPIIFFFDTIPDTDWAVCFDDDTDNNGTNNGDVSTWWSTCQAEGFVRHPTIPADIPNGLGWQDPAYVINIPSELDATDPQPFYGGRLYARYVSGRDDSYGWKIVIESRPYLVK